MSQAPQENTDRLQRRIADLEEELEREKGRADAAEFRADDLTSQLSVKDETIRWIFASKAYRLARIACRVLDLVLLPVRKLTEGTPSKIRSTGDGAEQADDWLSSPGKAELAPPEKPDLICLPIIDWEFRFQRPQQLVRNFAQDGHRVFYVRTTFHADGKKPGLKTVARNVIGTQLPGRPHSSIYKDAMTEADVATFVEAMDYVRRKEGIRGAAVLVDLPFWEPLARELRDRFGWKIVYDCMDEHGGFSTNATRMLESEDHLLRSSDLVLTTAKLLTEKARKFSDRVLPLPNAADAPHFTDATAHPSYDAMGHPIIGYFGAISDWFDIAMIEQAAKARPHWQFVLIGATTGAKIDPLKRLSNVTLKGEIPYSELPSHLAAFDVACIPFVDSELTRATNPVKFFEYLTAGVPVVSVDLYELSEYRDHYYSAHDGESFVRATEQALAENSDEKIAARRALAAQHTWQARHEALKPAVMRLFGKVAIVVVSYQNPAYMRACLESIAAHTIHPDYEVIVVDNASGNEVVQLLKDFAASDKRIRLVLNDDNRGFAKANNQGIELAKDADFIVLLNNDTIVTHGWLLALLRYFDNEDVGMIGPVTSFAGNEAKIDVDYDRMDPSPDQLERFAREYCNRHADLCFDIDVLAMFCVLVKRDTIDAIGLLDERYERGMFEDDDYSLRIRKHGKRTLCVEDVYIHHFGEASFGKIQKPEYHGIFSANKKRFEDKWGIEWVPHKYRDWPQDEPSKDRVRRFRASGIDAIEPG